MAGGISSVDSKFHKVCHLLLSEDIGTQELKVSLLTCMQAFFLYSSSKPRQGNQRTSATDKSLLSLSPLIGIGFPCL